MKKYFLLLLFLFILKIIIPQANFIKNMGQIISLEGELKPNILYTTESKGLSVYFGEKSISYVINNSNTVEKRIQKEVNKIYSPNKPITRQELEKNIREKSLYSRHQVEIKFLNTSENLQLLVSRKTNDFLNFYQGHCPNGILGVELYKKLTYNNLYKGVNAVYYSNEKGDIKYDFILSPNTNPNVIKMKIEGADDVLINKKGDLVIKTRIKDIIEKAPVAYQIINGIKKEIKIKFNIYENTIGFKLGNYDKNKELIIDPWVTYYGGTGDDILIDIVSDTNENIYAFGTTYSSNNISSLNGFQDSLNGYSDVVLVKFNKKNQRVWATYYGGANGDYGRRLYLDAYNNIYVAGETSSNDVIGYNGFQNTKGGSNDAFLVKFDTSGARIWGTYFGGINTDNAHTVFSTGNYVYLAGSTQSSNNISYNGYQNTFGGLLDGFLAKFDSTGNLIWSSYYGGPNTDAIADIKVDEKSNIYLAGNSNSPNVFYLNGYQNYSGSIDTYILKLDSLGNLVWGTYYGGTDGEIIGSLQIDKNNVYVSMSTSSNTGISYPTGLSTYSGNDDVAFLKLTKSGNIVWAKYFGGTGLDEYARTYFDTITYNLYFTFKTTSLEFQDFTKCRYQNVFRNSSTPTPTGPFNSLVGAIDTNGNELCNTYFGKNINTNGGISVTKNCILLAGNVINNGIYPTPDAFQTSSNSFGDGFIAKINKKNCGCDPLVYNREINNINSCANQCNSNAKISFSIDGYSYNYKWSSGKTTLNSTSSSDSISNLCNGNYWVEISIDSLCCGDTDTVYFNITNNTPVVNAICRDTTIYLKNNDVVLISEDELNNGSYGGCGNLVFSINKNSFDCSDTGANNLVFIAQDTLGNKDTCISTINIICEKDKIKIPQFISPNNDQKNDIFLIEGIEGYENNTLRVFNRYGNLVYESSPYKNNWKGTFYKSKWGDGNLPAGTYFYILDLGDNKSIPQKGYLQIKH